ncbi:MAG: hypothetical protein FWD06_00840 [Oscillospiraceae bacterium]|nr:hypothetical protein [Oscillospiraceae bacterium]
MRVVCRASLIILCAILLVPMFACSTGYGMDLYLFAERFNDSARGRAHLDLAHFIVQDGDAGGRNYQAFVGNNELLEVYVLPSGRVHTAALTGLPDMPHRDFYAAALHLLQAFAALNGDRAERLLGELQVGVLPVRGVHTIERYGYRVSYAANEAGRYVRLSCLRHLPTQPPLPTLRERID